MKTVGIIPAAGAGSRFGGEPKAFRRLAGRTVLQHAIARLRAGGIEKVVVAVAADRLEEMARTDSTVHWVAGGSTRQASVEAGLAAIESGPETLLAVHDGARPVVAPSDVRRTIEAAAASDGAVLGRSVVDTVKRLEDGRIRETVDRSVLFRAETPQVFRLGVLAASYARAREDSFVGTDEASVVERDPRWTVLAVEAQFPNPKLTYSADWAWIERLVTESENDGTGVFSGDSRPDQPSPRKDTL